ncbi:MAG: hypothetical protein [Caudoviricetes sp.]|nr:MAG: hypothetical protein [Caudoviricetes sp.]
MSVVSRTIDRYYAIKVMTTLSKEFPEWPAFKTGVIDAVGNVIKRAKTPAEKDSYTRFDAVMRPIKVALNRFPGGASALARAYLVKGFLYESDVICKSDYVELMRRALYEVEKLDECEEEDVWAIAGVVEALIGYSDFSDEMTSIFEEMVAGDSGGDPKKIAAGENSGAITRGAPQVLNKKKKKLDSTKKA